MAIQHGKDGTVKVGSNTVGSIVSWSLSEKTATADTTAMGATYETHVIGVISGDGTIECYLDPADATGQEALTSGASVTLNLYPQGTTTGKKYKTMTATLNALDLDVNVTAASKRKFGFKANGTISWSTAP